MNESIHDERLEQLVRIIEPHGKLLRAWQLTGGLSAHMTALKLLLPDGLTRKLILRQPGAATLQRNPNAAADEFKLLQVLKAAGIAAQTPYHLDQSGTLFPTPYLVIEYVEGEPEYSPENALALVIQIATQLARIHSLNGSTPELAFLPRQTGFTEKYDKPVASGESPEERRIREALRAAGTLPSLNQPTLLHGDFWPGNILWKDGILAAVIDWEDAMIGDPLADFAISRLDIRLIFGIDAMIAFTQGYQSLSAINYEHLPYWDLCAALRAASNLAMWASGFPQLGRPDITEQTLRDGLSWFIDQAFERLNISGE
jgi:aminoglycoside phosphotransferase (APT) family kinase protein